jgi:hypothetical protein
LRDAAFHPLTLTSVQRTLRSWRLVEKAVSEARKAATSATSWSRSSWREFG